MHMNQRLEANSHQNGFLPWKLPLMNPRVNGLSDGRREAAASISSSSPALSSSIIVSSFLIPAFSSCIVSISLLALSLASTFWTTFSRLATTFLLVTTSLSIECFSASLLAAATVLTYLFSFSLATKLFFLSSSSSIGAAMWGAAALSSILLCYNTFKIIYEFCIFLYSF